MATKLVEEAKTNKNKSSRIKFVNMCDTKLVPVARFFHKNMRDLIKIQSSLIFEQLQVKLHTHYIIPDTHT